MTSTVEKSIYLEDLVLNQGISHQQEGVRQDIRQFDAQNLGITLRNQLIDQWLRINAIPGKVKLIWGGESAEERKATGDLLQSLAQAGIELADPGITALSERLGLPLQRKATPTPPLALSRAGLTPFRLQALASTADVEIATDDIASACSAELARAFRGSLAPVRRLIALSTSSADLERRLREFYPDFTPDRQARLIEESLTAYLANGTANGAKTHAAAVTK